MGMTIEDEREMRANGITNVEIKHIKQLYETRLKAEKIAMLKELKSEFEEYEPKWAENEDQVIASNRTWDDFDDIIQKKINALKDTNE